MLHAFVQSRRHELWVELHADWQAKSNDRHFCLHVVAVASHVDRQVVSAATHALHPASGAASAAASVAAASVAASAASPPIVSGLASVASTASKRAKSWVQAASVAAATKRKAAPRRILLPWPRSS